MSIPHYGYLKPTREMMQCLITMAFAELLTAQQEKNPKLDYILRKREDVPKDTIPEYVIALEKELGYYFVSFEESHLQKNVYGDVKWSDL